MFKTQINRLLLVVVVFNLCAVIGCHRGYYRRQADAEARRLILEKSNNPRWDSSSGTIDIDPQSRMFDPFSADHPPIPPDDAASHQFMHCVDGKENYPYWHANGDTDYVESPFWRNYLPVNEDGQVVLNLERAYQLALINSPDLQQQRETLYLSALDVSLDRFGFDSQLFGGYNSFFTARGRFRGSREAGANPPAANGSSSTTFQRQLGANGGGINFEKLGITGTNFAVGLANTIMFNFAGNNTQSATSLVDFSVIQPLLRGAGRERIMASLTQAERTLLANVRQMERFRRGFYLEIAIGRSAGAGPNRGGNFLGTPGSASTNAGGFLGLLETQQRIRNQKFNVRQLENVLELFREFFLRERLDAVQLKSFETNVYRQQRTLLDLVTQYETSLDRFKLTLGLPPDLDVVIDDSYLDRFELISDQVNERLITIGLMREKTGTALNKVDNLFDELESVDDLDNPEFQWPVELAQLIEELLPFLENADATLEEIITEDKNQLLNDFEKLDGKRENRLAYLRQLQTLIENGEIISNVDPGLFKPESVQESTELRKRLSDTEMTESIVNRAAALKTQIDATRSRISQFSQTEKTLAKKELYQYIRNEFQEKIPGQLSEMNNLVLEISLLQAIARSNTIEIIDVNIDSSQAIEIARCMRLDWMNARASLVDNWRNIDFVANNLESQLDLVFEGDIGNTGDNPFKLRYETGQLRAGVRFDAPIVRMSERNQYRAALIEYQQSRRQFYQFEDNVKRNLREIVRNLNRNKVSFELDRRLVQVDIENVEINRFELEKPVGPNSGGSRLGATTAQNLTNAIIGLNNSQNSFLGSWVDVEVLRRSLDFDMGTMQLDERGEWIDPGVIDPSIGIRVANSLGIELNCQFCDGVPGFYSTQESGTIYTDQGSTGFPMAPSEPLLPFESNPNRSPRFDPGNQPADTDGIIVPVPRAPSLDQPDTGFRQPGRINRSPSHLFEPVSVRPATKPLSSKKSPQVDLKAAQIASVQAVPSVNEPKPRELEPSLEPEPSLEQKTPKSLEIPGPFPPAALMADRIADKFDEKVATQVTNLSPVQKSPLLEENTEENISVEGKELKTGIAPGRRDILEPATFRSVPPLTTSENPQTVTEVEPMQNWQSKHYSLGNALERFRLESAK